MRSSKRFRTSAIGSASIPLSGRYRSRADYVTRVALAVRELTEQGLLLAEDGDRYIEAAISPVTGWSASER